MFKNQLQELAQRSCFNLPAYACMREGPDHAPRFRASVNFNGEIFESPGYSPTLRQAEHSAAEVALNLLSSRGSKSLTARVLDETGVYKNLLQETAHKAGLNLPVYTTIRSGPGHVPVFTCTVELAGLSFTGDSAKTKKQAEKNAAISAWSSLKKMPLPSLVSKKESVENQHNDEKEEEEQMIVRRVLSNFKPQKSGKQNDHHRHYPNNHPRRSRNTRPWRSDYPLKYNNNINNNPWKQQNSFVDLLPPPPPRTTSKILPLTSKNNSIFRDKGQNSNFGDTVSDKPNAALLELGQSYFRNLFFGPLGCAQGGNMVNYCEKSNGIAQAVQIRSIIPVCATPPPPKSSSSSSSSSLVKPLPLNPPIKLVSDLNKLELND
ncbi:uncharacterized protein LOC141599160 [Silene latifolia]|uniref:uncharacterized protein LOC141599160 n=1 Tax=Silene latifolia TaxID=37657 RepID=UPI003D7791BB